MFNNIGGKIKSMVQIISFLGFIGSIFLAIYVFYENNYGQNTAFIGFTVLIVGCLISLIVCYFGYGFGELIEQTTSINKKLTKADNNHVLDDKSNPSTTQDKVTIVTTETTNPYKIQSEEEKIISDGGWKCPDCGKVNFKYNSRCECGTKKPLILKS